MNIFMNWTVSKKLLVGFGLSALTLIVVAVTAYFNAHRLVGDMGWVEHTYEVRSNLALLLSELKDAETGNRGFVITGDDSYLEPLNSALAAVPATLQTLRSLTADAQRAADTVGRDCADIPRLADIDEQRAACLLTGMGKDGARGLLKVRQAGGVTIAQDQSTSIVYGMPREAASLGAAQHILRIGEIAPRLASLQAFEAEVST